MEQAGPTRRAVLVGAGLLAAPGCSTGTGPRPPEIDPDVAIRAVATAGVRRLVDLYDEVATAHPALRGELAPLAAETTSHLGALAPPADPTAPPASTAPPVVTAPSTAPEARALLARTEREAAQSRVRELSGASPALARLLAAIGASEATHAALLGARR